MSIARTKGSSQKKQKPRMSRAAASPLQKPRKGAKRSKQYMVYVQGISVGVTFDVAEEARVKAKAARREISVEDLISSTVDMRFKALRRKRSYDERSELVVRFIKDVSAPRARRRAR